MRWSASCPNREERPELGMRTLPCITCRVLFDPAACSRHCARVRLLGDHGAMDVLSSRVLLHPTDPERSRVFYRDMLGLAIYREFGSGPERGTVFFLGGGFLELSGRAAAPPVPGMALWLQVRELAAVQQELGERGVPILREPKREPWGCWRCGSPTRMGCASASWRCRRSIRCAAATEAAPPSPPCLAAVADPLPGRFSSTAAAGAGRWMRSSRAPGPARSGCRTSRAASGWCAAPPPPIRRRARLVAIEEEP